MNHQTRVYNDVFEMLPSEENPTPLVRINRLNPVPDFQLFAKLEWANPFGSVKDRAAWEMLRDLEERGEVGSGRGLVEPTSGNTGISLAAMARARGYHMRAVVPNKIPRSLTTSWRLIFASPTRVPWNFARPRGCWRGPALGSFTRERGRSFCATERALG